MLLGGMTWLVVTEWYRRGVGNYEKGTKCSFFWGFLIFYTQKNRHWGDQWRFVLCVNDVTS